MQKIKPFDPSELDEVASTEQKKYRIVCLQGAGFSSWDDPHTEQDILLKFWDYAYNDDMFDEVEQYYQGAKALIPDWFNIKLVCDLWEVELEEIK